MQETDRLDCVQTVWLDRGRDRGCGGTGMNYKMRITEYSGELWQDEQVHPDLLERLRCHLRQTSRF